MRGKALVVVLSWLVAGCVSVSTYQTAETVATGKVAFGFSANYGGFSGEGEYYIMPFPELYGRYGVTDFIDMGVKYTPPFSTIMDLKFQLLDQDRGAPLFMALDLGGSIYSVESSFVSFLYPALLLSRRWGNTHPYLALKGLYAVGAFDSEEDTIFTTSDLYPGIGFGIQFGRRVKFAPEVNFLYADEDNWFYQGGIGFMVIMGD